MCDEEAIVCFNQSDNWHYWGFCILYSPKYHCVDCVFQQPVSAACSAILFEQLSISVINRNMIFVLLLLCFCVDFHGISGKLIEPRRGRIRITFPCHIYPLILHFYIEKLGYGGVYLFFLFLLQNIDCGYSLEPPRQGGSNVYPQSMV